jgi:hypothetical protein
MKRFGMILMLISAGSLVIGSAYFQRTAPGFSDKFMLLDHWGFYTVSLSGVLAGLILHDNLF